MFEDLVPSAPAQTPAPSPGLFDDLIPAGGVTGAAASGISGLPGGPDGLASPRSTAGTNPGTERIDTPERNDQPAIPFSDSQNTHNGTSAGAGLFDDLIPTRAASAGTAGGAFGAQAPLYEPIPDPSLGLKDAKTGIPLVREFKPGRFIADVAGEDDGGLFWKDPETGEIRRPGSGELIRPEGGKFKVYERQEIVRPWTVADMALVRGIVSGFTAPRDVWAGDVAPNDVIGRAVDFASLGVGGARTPITTWRPRGQLASPRPELAEESALRSSANGETRSPPNADPNAAPPDGGTGATGPPTDQGSSPQNGAPSGAVFAFGGGQVLRLAMSRLAGRPRKRGQPPIGDDGHPVELHHEGQVHDGLVREMTRTDHRLGENYRINHPNTGQRASLIDRVRFGRERYRYWAGEWDKRRFGKLPEMSPTQMEEMQETSRPRLIPPARRSNE